MDEAALGHLLQLFAFDLAVISLDDFLKDLSRVLDLIERPLLGLSLAGDLLLH